MTARIDFCREYVLRTKLASDDLDPGEQDEWAGH